MASTCLSCGADEWVALDGPNAGYALASDGTFVHGPFAKAECANCGLVQKSLAAGGAEAVDAFYETEYDLYNHRPEAERFETGRYPAMARTVLDAVGPSAPRRVLEIGCGNGSTIAELARAWPEAEIIGLEPMPSAVREAQQRGLPVVQGVLGTELPAAITGRFDVVYSLHVIEHVPDPVAFLRAMEALMVPGGRAVISCPNALEPSAELLYADHLCSMTPHHLDGLVRRVGLAPLTAGPCSGGGGRDHQFNQFIAVERPADAAGGDTVAPPPLDHAARQALSAARRRYIAAWRGLDGILSERVGDSVGVYCFGAGGWAAMLAGYAPQAWERVRACVIDGGSSHEFHGKAILDRAALADGEAEVMLMGVNPAIQHELAQRFRGTVVRPVTFHDVIPA